MLRFITRTVKLTVGTIIGLALMLFLSLSAVVVLLVQLIAHNM